MRTRLISVAALAMASLFLGLAPAQAQVPTLTAPVVASTPLADQSPSTVALSAYVEW